MANAFDGIRILDLSTNIAGPNCCAYFADFGAEVIKIERPVTGDDARTYAPLIDGSSLGFWYLNRGKKAVTLDLRDPRGIEILKKLVEDADVLVESNRPGVSKKLGIDYDTLKELNPRLVYCSVSVYGQTSLYAQKPGFDMIAQAQSGLMDYNGDPNLAPNPFSFAIGDYLGGLQAVIGIAFALMARERTGKGQYVDISMVDSLISLHPGIDTYSVTKRVLTRSGRHQRQSCPYGMFEGKNGQSVVIATTNNKLWLKVCDSMGEDGEALRNNPDYANNSMRAEHRDEIIPVIEAWLKKFDNIDEAIAILEANGVPNSKVLGPVDVLNDPNYTEVRKTIVDMVPPSDVTSVKSFKTRAPVPRLSDTPGCTKQAPARDEHSVEIFSRYGYNKDYIEALEAEWDEKYRT